ncbi:MAG: hypothetical protein FJ298_03095 [Planctomycetes bacterium]|nr:hypothetical protein [Planctomycetota bacterium]
MNACRDFRTRLASLLAGRASSASFGELAWHEHLLGCAQCRALVEAEEALEELLASLPRPQLPPELAQRLLARLESVRGDAELDTALDTALDTLLERGGEVAVPLALAARMLAKLDGARAAQSDQAQGGQAQSGQAHSDQTRCDEARLDALLARLPQPHVPADLSRRTLSRLSLARRTRRASPRRLALAAAALVVLAVGAWTLLRSSRREPDDNLDLVRGPAPRSNVVAPRERVLDEPPADLLASLDLLESWDFVVDDSIEADVLALDAFDALLLDVADELEAESPSQLGTERRNG